MLLGVTVVLLLIFLSNSLVRYLGQAAAGQLPGDVIFQLVALKAVKYLILLVPLSLYLAILLVLGRMYRDNEMAAMGACGIGIMRLYRPLLLIALPLSVVLAWLSLQTVPRTNDLELRIIDAAKRKMGISAIKAGRFREGRGGERIIYAEKISDDGTQLSNVFIHARVQDKIVLLSAEKGVLEDDPKTRSRYLVLLNGYRYDGLPGSVDYRIVKFQKHGLLIRPSAEGTLETKRTAVPSSQLWHSTVAADQAELQWRMAVPLGTLVLMVLAVPLGRVSPRKGMYGKLFVAVLVYIFYFNLLALAETWTDRGTIPVALGLWWVHGLLLLFGFILLVRHYGLRWIGDTIRSKGGSTHSPESGEPS
jgi:lipopolysaccharide export system permease protein